MPDYVEALCGEIAWVASRFGPLPIRTVYFGGGTPSLLLPSDVSSILNAIAANLELARDAEITMEANPRTLTEDYCRQIYALGVNRLSIGAQSAQPADLQLFNRQHEWSDVTSAMTCARAGGFTDISLDLIYGAPGQDIRGWRDSLQHVFQLAPEHVSMYAMGIEKGTPLHEWVASKRLSVLGTDLTADMYDVASQLLAAAGFEQYEISNWAVPGYECRHNLQYWRNMPYLGIGAGAYGYVPPTRYSNVDNPVEYIECVQSGRPGEGMSPAQDIVRTEVLTETEMRAETMILGLRLTKEGVLRSSFEKRHGQSIESVYGPILDTLEAKGLLQVNKDRILLSNQSRLTANQALIEFV